MKIWMVFLSIFFQESLFSAQYTINFSTWYDFVNLNASDPGGATKLLKGLNAAGASPSALHADDGPNTTYDGDLIELGFYKLASGAASTTAFKGVWTPITSKTTIGQDASFLTSPPNTTTNYTVPAGEFQFNSIFYLSQAGKTDGQGYINNTGASSYRITDLATDGAANLAIVDNATSNLLGIRFYDINTGGDGSTTKATNGTTRYNTIMDAAWTMPGTGGTVNMALHDNSGGSMSVNSSVVFEFDNTAAYTANLAKVGTSNTRVENDDYVSTVTYHDGSSNLDLDASGIGSAVLSGLSGSGNLLGGDDGSTLTIHSAAGNTGNDAFDFTGNIYESGSASTDLSIVKTGGGDQKLTGNINLASGSGDKGYINLTAGGLILNPGSGETQVIEYLKGAAGTTLTLDNTGASTIELGFAQSQSGATFSGGVVLTGSGSSNIIKVATGTTAADYAKEQIFATGVISGSEKLAKSGVGRLKLTGDNTFSGNMDIDDGTVVAGHADALGASGNTITINKGKLEVSSGITLSQGTISGGTNASKKSMIGGDGTVSSIVIGSGSGEIDFLTPGQGISSSLTETSGLTKNQAGFGNGAADDSIGSFTATTLSLQGGGVFDWELQDFDGTSGGTDYDVMNFTNLALGAKSETFTINILGIKSSDGSVGAPDNFATKERTGTNGFKFLNNNNSSGITWTGGTQWTQAELNSYFVFNTDSIDYNTNNWEKNWEVFYDSGDFYLQYTATPEPSTYIMVTGLFMLPGFRMFKRWRKKFSSSDEDSEVT